MARLAGVTPEAVRYYESRGLLNPPERDASGYRRYSEQALEQLRLIKAAQAFGFSLDEIGRILAQFRDGPAACPPVREIVQARIESIDALIASLRGMRQRLSSAIDNCGEGPCELDAQMLGGRRAEAGAPA
jgi:DNA-binding transcriptional MerR regulator